MRRFSRLTWIVVLGAALGGALLLAFGRGFGTAAEHALGPVTGRPPETAPTPAPPAPAPRTAPTPAGLQGRVADPTGQPIGNARVEAWYEPAVHGEQRREAAGTTSTRRDGRFDLVLEPGRTYFLVARHPEFAPGPALRQIRTEAGRSLDVGSITLVSGLVLRGQVVDADRVPVPRVALVLEEELPEDLGPFEPAPRHTVSDTHGGFAFVGLAAATYRLAADPTGPRHAGLVVHDLRPRPAQAPPIEVKLGRGHTLRGRVRRADGRAAAGDRLVLRPLASNPDRQYRSKTNDAGQFEIEGLHAGRWRLFVRALDNRTPATTMDITLPVATPIELRLETDLTALVRVVTPGSTLPAEVRVRLFAPGAKTGLGVALEPMRRYRIEGSELRLTGLSAGAFDVELRAPGFAPAWIEALEVDRDPALRSVTLRPGARLAGTAQDANGKPVSGLALLALAADSPRSARALRLVEAMRGAILGRAHTDARGAFEMADLAPGAVRIVAAGRPALVLAEATLAEGATRRLRIQWPPRTGGLALHVATGRGAVQVWHRDGTWNVIRTVPRGGVLHFDDLQPGRYGFRRVDRRGTASFVQVLPGQRVRADLR